MDWAIWGGGLFIIAPYSNQSKRQSTWPLRWGQRPQTPPNGGPSGIRGIKGMETIADLKVLIATMKGEEDTRGVCPGTWDYSSSPYIAVMVKPLVKQFLSLTYPEKPKQP